MHSLAPFVQDIKQSSARWIHEASAQRIIVGRPDTLVFTVSVSARAAVKGYITDQVSHFRTETFQEEYVALPQKRRVEYGEKYIW